MKIQYILETCIYAEALEPVETFYKEILGLKMFARRKGRHVFFKCDHQMLLIFNPNETTRPDSEVPPHGAHGQCHVAFAIPASDVDRWRTHLAQHDVSVEKEMDWPGGGHSLYFRDPAGNSVELATSKTWEMGHD